MVLGGFDVNVANDDYPRVRFFSMNGCQYVIDGSCEVANPCSWVPIDINEI